MSDIKIEGIPALIYSAFWQTREMGFLKRILNELNIASLKIAFFFKDYLPGAFIEFDGVNGDFKVTAINSLDGVKYDGAIIGKLGPVIKTLEGAFLLKGFYVIFTRRIRFKGIMNLLKFYKIFTRCAF